MLYLGAVLASWRTRLMHTSNHGGALSGRVRSILVRAFAEIVEHMRQASEFDRKFFVKLAELIRALFRDARNAGAEPWLRAELFYWREFGAQTPGHSYASQLLTIGNDATAEWASRLLFNPCMHRRHF